MRVLVVVLVAFMMAACGSSNEAETSTKPETTNESSDGEPPPMPRAAKDDTDSGAFKFVKHYIDVLNYSLVTGDTSELEKLSASQCDGCATYIDLIDETYSQDGYFKTSGWKVKPIEVEPNASSRRVLADARVPKTNYKSAAGESEKHDPPETTQLVMAIEFDGERPQLTELSLNEEGSN